MLMVCGYSGNIFQHVQMAKSVLNDLMTNWWT
jgi:hypothetical protein